MGTSSEKKNSDVGEGGRRVVHEKADREGGVLRGWSKGGITFMATSKYSCRNPTAGYYAGEVLLEVEPES